MKLSEIKTYHRNGQLWSLRYEDASRKNHGFEYYYYDNGQLAFLTTFENDVRHGEAIHYDLYGDLKYHDVWINGNFYSLYAELSEIDKFELSLKHGIIWFSNV